MTGVFVGYNHKQGEWVWERPVPALRAGGAERPLDKERFKVGLGLPGQMDAMQDQADVHVLCLSTNYYASAACLHEMDRAIALDPHFRAELLFPCALTMRRCRWRSRQLTPCGSTCERTRTRSRGTSCCDAAAPTSARRRRCGFARDEIVTYLATGRIGQPAGARPRRALGGTDPTSREDHFPHLACTDLLDPVTVPRDGLLNRILEGLGSREQVRHPPYDLGDFETHRFVDAGPRAGVPRPLRSGATPRNLRCQSLQQPTLYERDAAACSADPVAHALHGAAAATIPLSRLT